MEYLRAHEIVTGVHYPVPVHLQPAYLNTAREGSLPVSEKAAGETLSLPMYPELASADVARVAASVRSFFKDSSDEQ